MLSYRTLIQDILDKYTGNLIWSSLKIFGIWYLIEFLIWNLFNFFRKLWFCSFFIYPACPLVRLTTHPILLKIIHTNYKYWKLQIEPIQDRVFLCSQILVNNYLTFVEPVNIAQFVPCSTFLIALLWAVWPCYGRLHIIYLVFTGRNLPAIIS